MTIDLLRHAPPKPDLPSGMKWDVFISYRAVDRSWTLQLYDILRQLGYAVFLDQFNLVPGRELLAQLTDGLAASANAVLVWSGASADSDWVQIEHSAMREHATSRSFRYVVACLADSKPPLFAANALWVDFPATEGGPSGTSLLKLLWGLAGKPLPRAAIAEVEGIDDRVKRDLFQIRGHQHSANAQAIVDLAQSTDEAWTSTALLGSAAAEALVRMAHYPEAIAILEKLRERFPSAVRPSQLLGLALTRSGRTAEAISVLRALYEAGERDSETLGLYARNFMDRYRRQADRSALGMARDLYVEAFSREPDNYYLGLNAASASVFLGELPAAQQLALQVETRLGERSSDDIWVSATRAEVELVLRRFEGAASTYKLAFYRFADHRGSLDSMRRQGIQLLDHLEPTPAERELVLKVLQGADA